ncbi:major pollen allergen Cor a 1 isoforms 5, 6, 11 and 16-like [Lycium ferocissimum]|uniref:major pollen allergen Cor a 1 isoforms 5, 6, 11 and 16-like n=1 Tax=Lycium ferocissimum TaxID=112874 RepID=UPI0028156552|nr:major pollen allergen Cor a 1 isoforms 5, 6, 11 and 16-like [Lycium ferocissimum]
MAELRPLDGDPPLLFLLPLVDGTYTGNELAIKLKYFHTGSNLKSIKYRIDELNEHTFTYKYTLIEGEALIEKLEKITYEVKFQQSASGSISKVTSKYYIEGDFKLNESEQARKRGWLCTKHWRPVSFLQSLNGYA